MKTLRRAVTMIELVFVIIILGIVAGIGAEIVSQTYRGYILQRAQFKAGIKTELALNQIANRLRYAIPGTLGVRADLTSAFVPLTQVTTTNDKVLQWVGYDGDGFEAIAADNNRKPGWSGFCDLSPSNATTIKTPGSNLSLEDKIIKKLSDNNKTISDAYIYFPDYTFYKISGVDASNETVSLATAVPSGGQLYERYKLAWSSYALEVDDNGDLILHYNFDATPGAAITNDLSRPLLRNVTNFKFKGGRGSMRLKICVEEPIGTSTDAKIHVCKEKVIF